MPGVLFFGYIVGDLLKVPVSLIVLPLSFVFLWSSRRSSAVSPVRVLKEAPWSIVFFSIGMYVVVCGLEKCRFDDPLGALIARLEKGGVTLAPVGMGFLAALLSSVMNNVPPVMVEAPANEASGVTGLFKAALIFANVIRFGSGIVAYADRIAGDAPLAPRFGEK
ncbi:ArsB/NhaD family transporter [Hydrogenibacillus sp. N12]|uniref:ArsB/NhaD family transporter n=1 Tax=Hydrogenibacillus sp. N12 TaxID=2866627 RepID=UPI001C7E0BEF|nr:ArsB/NhaD family transporter [Hydrogenibacillus sp. N12]QZA33594.1 hypothetical protein K2M58_03390 [Hydrogenibacillus sp. N12]